MSEDGGLADWEERAGSYRRIPQSEGDAGQALDRLEILRQETRDPLDLFFLEQAMVEVGERWPDSLEEVSRRRSRFFDHLPPPPPELFETLEVPSLGTTLVWRDLPAGGFAMGSPASEPNQDDETAPLGAHADERPQHEVRFTRPFSMMSTPVTTAQYLASHPSHEV